MFDRVLERAGPLEGEHCLEIGCGGGRLLERALAAGATCVGVDHSADMLALTRDRNLVAIERGSLELELSDAADLPWRADTFSVVVCANTFFFVEEPECMLNEAARVLTPGGRLVIATVPGPLPAASPRKWWVYVWGSRMHTYDDETMHRMVADAGLRDIMITRDTRGEPVQLVSARR